MNILQAIDDPNLLRPFLADGKDRLDSWSRWLVALSVLYGLPFPQEASAWADDLIRDCTGRDPAKLPKDGFNTTLFLTGRRSGKSRTTAVVAAFEAVLAGRENRLSKGERGTIPIVSPTKGQSRVVRDYVRAIFEVPLLAGEVAAETREGFELKNGTRIEILAGDWRTVRNFTCLAVVVDEAAFLGYSEESKVRSDTELIRALKPSLATSGGRLIAISSPYAMKGWTYQTFKRHHANDAGKVLVWNCPSRTMNPTLPQSVVDDALAEDYASAKAEYLGEFRDDVATFLPRDVIERLVVKGRRELLPKRDVAYTAFADLSGGRADDAALGIAHKGEAGTVVLDKIVRYRPPFSPQEVIREMAAVLREYGCRWVTGDNYSAEFTASAFRSAGLYYRKAEKPKSQLYSELLPRLCSGEVKLLDDPVLISQLAGLERRTRSGGRDVIDHPPGSHDDVANVAAGAIVECVRPRVIAGAL